MVSALEWAEIRALERDGVSQRQIAKRLGINRRTVAKALAAEAPPRYVRPLAGSQLDPLMPVIGQVLEQWPDIKAPRLTELLRVEHGYEDRSISCAADSRGCGRRWSVRRSGRAIGRGRWCSSIGVRCRRAPGSPGSSVASTR